MPAEYCDHYTSAVNQLKVGARDRNMITHQAEEEEYCQKHGLNRKAMRKTHLYVEDIIRRLQEVGYYVGEKCRLADRRSDLIRNQRKNGKDVDYIRLLKVLFGKNINHLKPTSSSLPVPRILTTSILCPKMKKKRIRMRTTSTHLPRSTFLVCHRTRTTSQGFSKLESSSIHCENLSENCG